MATHGIRRIIVTLLLGAFALLALPLEGSILPTSRKVSAPQDDAAYQALMDAANSVVGIKVKALRNARSNETLGEERTGSGIVISPQGLVLTIGYLILEADTVEIVDSSELTVPGAVVAYDHATGFGLVRPLAPIKTTPIRMGTAKPVSQLDRLMIVTGGEEQTVSIATVVSKRQFAGYWEYLIDNAIFTSPPRFDHSGAALINKDGELVGVGSLFVMDAITPGERMPGNMFVPVDLIKPILDEMVKTGGQQGGSRPWLGVNSREEDGRVKVVQVNEESPAAQAGIEAGDIILSVHGQPVTSLENFYTMLWNAGPAGSAVRLTVLHGVTPKEVTVKSIDRRDFMRKKIGV
jgi:serine protease Do